jgi:hypothetical protein
MPRWTSDDIPWGSFDNKKTDPEILKLIKAAALTEYNAASYTQYLKNVFAGDAAFCGLVEGWQREEEQHGLVLGRYAQLADPDFDFQAAFQKFHDGYVIPVDAQQSVRGSRMAELLSRCVVETGTSSFYRALGDATEEPVLKAICRAISQDEIRHYRMFLDALRRYEPTEKLSLVHRLRILIGRINETGDDELPFAYHCANETGLTYDRRRAYEAYGARFYRLYQFPHAQSVVRMVFNAGGLPTEGLLPQLVSRWAWRKMKNLAADLAA